MKPVRSLLAGSADVERVILTTSDCPDYEELKNLAQELGRPAESMCVLDVKTTCSI
jgi:hypothetical protein